MSSIHRLFILGFVVFSSISCMESECVLNKISLESIEKLNVGGMNQDEEAKDKSSYLVRNIFDLKQQNSCLLAESANTEYMEFSKPILSITGEHIMYNKEKSSYILYDLKLGKELVRVNSQYYFYRVSADQKKLLLSTKSGFSIIDIDGEKSVNEKFDFDDIIWSHDNKNLFMATPHEIYQYCLESKKLMKIVDLGQHNVQKIALSQDGKLLCMSGIHGLYIFDLSAGTFTEISNVNFCCTRKIDWAENDSIIITQQAGDAAPETIFVIDSKSGTILYSYRSEDFYALSPDKKHLAFTNAESDLINIIRINDRQCVYTIDCGSDKSLITFRELGFSDDGSRLRVCTGNKIQTYLAIVR